MKHRREDTRIISSSSSSFTRHYSERLAITIKTGSLEWLVALERLTLIRLVANPLSAPREDWFDRQLCLPGRATRAFPWNSRYSKAPIPYYSNIIFRYSYTRWFYEFFGWRCFIVAIPPLFLKDTVSVIVNNSLNWQHSGKYNDSNVARMWDGPENGPWNGRVKWLRSV